MNARIDRFVDRIAGGLAMIGALGVVVMLLHIMTYVITRHVLSAPIPATVEIVSGYYMVMVAFLPLAWAERRGDMITVTIFEDMFPPTLSRVLAVFVALVTLGAYVLLTYATWHAAAREYQTGAFVISLNVAVPTWPGYFMLPAGFAMATLIALHRVVTLLVTGRQPANAIAAHGGDMAA